MKLHPYIPPINATVRTIDGLIGTVVRVDIESRVYTPQRDHNGQIKRYVVIPDGLVTLRIPEGHTSVSIYNIRPCIRE